MYYECHISIGLHPVSARPLIEALNSWSFSCISGDPILGKDTYEYATRHVSGNTNFQKVLSHINTAAHILREQGFPVLRQKIELVIYDTIKED